MIDIEQLKFDKDGLIPAIVVDNVSKKVLTLAYMNRESLKITMEKNLTCFYSRSRQELWLKGENMMDGYVTPEDNAIAYEDGYFKTGDLARVDEEGYLYITGRTKEIIVLSSGENVSPAELEVKFAAIDAIQDCLVYEMREGAQELLVLEVLPRMTTVKALGITDLYTYLKGEVDKINETLPSFEKINKLVIRDTDFIRTPAMKIARNLNGNVKK